MHQIAFIASLAVVLAAVAVVDSREERIPDPLNALLLVLGFAWCWQTGARPLIDAVIASGVGFAVMLAVREAYYRVRNRHGLGLGDVKFMAAAGPWTGVEGFTTLMLIATLSALAWIAGRSAFGAAISPTSRIPFGPFLALGLLTTVGLGIAV